MKKMLLMFFAAAMLLSLLSCGGEQSANLVERPEAVPSPEEEQVAPVQDVEPLKLDETEAMPSLPAPTDRETPSTPVPTEPVSELLPPVVPEPISTPVPQPAHVHDWKPIVDTVHHEAVTEQITVVDVPATEGHFEGGSYEVMVCRCGEVFTSGDAWLTHAHAGGIDEHGGFTTSIRSDQVWVEGSSEVAHYETRVLQDAWDEEVITGAVCASCGATK